MVFYDFLSLLILFPPSETPFPLNLVLLILQDAIQLQSVTGSPPQIPG